MKRILIALMIVPAIVCAQTSLQNADKRLATLVAPGNLGPAAYVERPVAWNTPQSLENFSLPVRPYAGTPVLVPMMAAKDVKPRPAAEGTPLMAYREDALVPVQAKLPTKPLLKAPSPDVHAALPIPILAQPTKDRASLADPAFDASLAATLKPVTPARETPTPFVPLNLPDPFENARFGQLRHPPAESATPPVIPIDRPTK